MRYAAANPKESGVPKSVSAEFNKSDPGGALPDKVENGKAVRNSRYSHARSRMARGES